MNREELNQLKTLLSKARFDKEIFDIDERAVLIVAYDVVEDK